MQGSFTTAFAEEKSIGVLVDLSANGIPEKDDCAVPDRIEKIPIDVNENKLTMRASSDETQADTIALDTFYSLSMEPGYIYRFYFTLELSSQVQHQAKENLIGRFPVEAFAGTVIQFSSEGREVAVVKGLEIH